MIRLFTISLGGQAYLNFMGNEFGHPDWIDFPREGNNWSYHYARRMWSLVEKRDLKFHFLGAFDKAMLNFVRENEILNADFGIMLNVDILNKTVIFERNGLIFIFNFHTEHSIPDYKFIVPKPGDYRIILNTDNPAFGGHGRIDEKTVFITQYLEKEQQHILQVYNTNRTALVLKKISR
jgi:1,4-alpha-glucan branching enzyme